MSSWSDEIRSRELFSVRRKRERERSFRGKNRSARVESITVQISSFSSSSV